MTRSGRPGRPVSSSGPVGPVTPVAGSGWSGRPVRSPRSPVQVGPVAGSPRPANRPGPVDQVRSARSPGQVTPVARSGWSGHGVVETGNRPGPVDQVRSARSPGQFVWSGRPGHPGRRFRLVRSPIQVGPVARSVCPFRPGNRPGPVDRVRSAWSPGQFARSPVQVGPVARSVRPFRPGNRTGPVDQVRSARSPGHVQSLQYDILARFPVKQIAESPHAGHGVPRGRTGSARRIPEPWRPRHMGSSYTTTLACLLRPLLQHITKSTRPLRSWSNSVAHDSFRDVRVVPQRVREIGLEWHSSIMFC